MNLMERNRRRVLLALPPSGARDPDAAAEPENTIELRAVLTPYEETVRQTAFGLVRRRGVQLLYDGTQRLAAGMLATVDAATADERRYRVQSVRRYPWLQAAELAPVEDA